jgi:hypothetical protein
MAGQVALRDARLTLGSYQLQDRAAIAGIGITEFTAA